MSTTIQSQEMQAGDRIKVEPAGEENFEATVSHPLGWGMVHGVFDWLMRADDDTTFVYGIAVGTPVEVLNR